MNKGMNEFRINQHVSLGRCKILLFDGDAEDMPTFPSLTRATQQGIIMKIYVSAKAGRGWQLVMFSTS